jgi:flagellum-specific peptidoglycan hydrolase FlgJ
VDETKMDFTAEELKTIPELNLKSFITLVEHLGRDIESRSGIPYMVPIIQAAHESRYGNSGLARNHGNLFGITATKSWTDKGRPIALLPTWEFINGKRVEMKREFRAYRTWRESFEDWSDIITRLSVYKNALALFKDNRVRDGIEAMAGVYATDPAYARKLVDLYSTIEGGK